MEVKGHGIQDPVIKGDHFALSLGSVSLAEVSCHVTRTLKQPCRDPQGKEPSPAIHNQQGAEASCLEPREQATLEGATRAGHVGRTTRAGHLGRSHVSGPPWKDHVSGPS